jgi:hypothetical protein
MEVTAMSHRNDASKDQSYMGFAIRELDGWYVGVLLQPQLWKVFEAETRNVLEHKIRRYWVTSR